MRSDSGRVSAGVCEMTSLMEAIRLDRATLCETCLCITESQGDTCLYCKAPTLVNLQKLLEYEVPAAPIEDQVVWTCDKCMTCDPKHCKCAPIEDGAGFKCPEC